MTATTPNGISAGDTVTIADGLGTVALVTGVRYSADVVTAVGTFHYGICTKREARAIKAGPVIIRMDSPRTGVYTISVEYASTGQPIPELGFGIDDRELAMDAYTRRVSAFDAGMTVEHALETMAAATATAQPKPRIAPYRPLQPGESQRMTVPQARVLALCEPGDIIHAGGWSEQLATTSLEPLHQRRYVIGYLGEGADRYRLVYGVATEDGIIRAREVLAECPIDNAA
jgi:hypothetical protein